MFGREPGALAVLLRMQCCPCPTIVHARPLSMPDHCPCSTIVHVRPLSMSDHCPCPTIVHARPLSMSDHCPERPQPLESSRRPSTQHLSCQVSVVGVPPPHPRRLQRASLAAGRVFMCAASHHPPGALFLSTTWGLPGRWAVCDILINISEDDRTRVIRPSWSRW